MRNKYVNVFECGSLLLLWRPEGRQLFVAHHGVTLEQILETNAQMGLSLRGSDGLAESIADRYYDMWDWERAEFGRNRWEELEQRGGGVHISRTSEAPEPYRW